MMYNKNKIDSLDNDEHSPTININLVYEFFFNQKKFKQYY